LIYGDGEESTTTCTKITSKLKAREAGAGELSRYVRSGLVGVELGSTRLFR